MCAMLHCFVIVDDYLLAHRKGIRPVKFLLQQPPDVHQWGTVPQPYQECLQKSAPPQKKNKTKKKTNKKQTKVVVGVAWIW